MPEAKCSADYQTGNKKYACNFHILINFLSTKVGDIHIKRITRVGDLKG